MNATLRDVVTPKPGTFFLPVDYKNIELRIMRTIAEGPTDAVNLHNAYVPGTHTGRFQQRGTTIGRFRSARFAPGDRVLWTSPTHGQHVARVKADGAWTPDAAQVTICVLDGVWTAPNSKVYSFEAQPRELQLLNAVTMLAALVD